MPEVFYPNNWDWSTIGHVALGFMAFLIALACVIQIHEEIRESRDRKFYDDGDY